MDEVLLRRLLGALVLFGGLFLLSGLLPDADAPGPVAQGHKQRVQIDLLPKPEAPPRVAPQPAAVDQDEPETERKPVPEAKPKPCLLYTSPSPRDRTRYRMPSSA